MRGDGRAGTNVKGTDGNAAACSPHFTSQIKKTRLPEVQQQQQQLVSEAAYHIISSEDVVNDAT